MIGSQWLLLEKFSESFFPPNVLPNYPPLQKITAFYTYGYVLHTIALLLLIFLMNSTIWNLLLFPRTTIILPLLKPQINLITLKALSLARMNLVPILLFHPFTRRFLSQSQKIFYGLTSKLQLNLSTKLNFLLLTIPFLISTSMWYY